MFVFGKSVSIQEETALIGKSGKKIFMAEIRENLYALFAFEIVVYGKVTESRAALILKAGCHQDIGLNPGCKVLYIQVGQLPEVFLFPKMMTDMLAVGEQSGDMAGALGHIGVRYEKQMDKNIKMFTNALEPLLIVFIGGIVGFVAVGILMAVLKATASLGAGG